MDRQIARVMQWLRRPEPDEERSASRLLGVLALPRSVGSPGAARVGREMDRRFRELGYEVRTFPFSFSAFPGRFGIPLLGVLLLACAGAWVVLMLEGHATAALAVLALPAIAAGTAAFLARRLISRFSWQRLEGENWLFTRPDARPRYLVSAHRDSKSQPVPMLVRAVGLCLAAAGWVALVILGLFAALAGAVALPVVLLAGGGTIAGAVVALLSWSDNRSPGALDNATGLAALLVLAGRLRDLDQVGFLVTDGEELGLAGAMDVAPKLPPVAGIINLDGLLDSGPVHLIERFGVPPRGRAPHLAASLMTAGEAMELSVRRRDLPPGVLVEHVAFVRAGIPSLTIMRGGVKGLLRVHTPADRAARLAGRGVVVVAAMVETALRSLLADDDADPAPLLAPSSSSAGGLLRGDADPSPLLGGR